MLPPVVMYVYQINSTSCSFTYNKASSHDSWDIGDAATLSWKWRRGLGLGCNEIVIEAGISLWTEQCCIGRPMRLWGDYNKEEETV